MGLDAKPTWNFTINMIRRHRFGRFPPSRVCQSQQKLTRYIIFALIALLVILKFPTPISPPIHTYRIQATFPRETGTSKAVRLQRQSIVKEEFLHAWNGYKSHAWLHDEVLPLSGAYKDPFVGWAASLVDPLDTLWIMGLKDEFEDALKSLHQIDFTKPNGERVPVFETVIRYLGGLLGAWDISGHRYPILLSKATELGDFLYAAFNTESGVPTPYFWWDKTYSGKIPGENGVLVAQIGSLSLEFIRLSQVTGNMKYANAIQVVTDLLEKTQNHTSLPGMWPSQADCMGKHLHFTSNSYTLGAFADSAFEYLPKTSLLVPPSSRSAAQYLNMYNEALATFSEHLFFRPLLPGNPDILFPGSAHVGGGVHLDTSIEHLACFTGGMVALGSRINNSPSELETGRKLTDGCVWAYEHTPSGIMPEIFHTDYCPDINNCNWEGEGSGFRSVDDASYQLRPEAIE